MFDGTLNEDTADRIAHSRLSRFRKQTHAKDDGTQDEVFCDTCRGHQRVVYQLLSNYIPDEDDDNYQAFYDDADGYRQRVEERYPVACAACAEKVQGILSRQNYKFKSSLLNSTLSKSRGDSIRPTRKYPKLSWIFLGACWAGSQLAWFFIELEGLYTRQPLLNAQEIRRGDIARAFSKSLALLSWPGFMDLRKLSVNMTDHEKSVMLIAVLLTTSLAGLFWDRTLGAIQVSPRRNVRIQWFYSWSRLGAALLLSLQLAVLAGLLSTGYNLQALGFTLLLHALCILAFIQGKTIHESPEVDIRYSGSPRTTSHQSMEQDIKRDGSKVTAGSFGQESPRPQPQVFRSSTDPFLERPESPSWQHEERLGLGSDVNTLRWSPAKPVDSARSSTQFGMYREPRQSSGFRERSEGSDPYATAGLSRAHSAPLTSSGTTDNRFRSRAYEPSPLANPSVITSMGLSSMSLGSFFGFPSAKFQPPENLFAHRSASGETGTKTDVWSYRKQGDSGFSGASSTQANRRRPLVDDDDDRHSFKDRTMDMDEDNDLSWTFGSSSRIGENSKSYAGRGAIAPQRYFPPEPETGLEDNFFGVVKIVDDYLPPASEPRTIAARNLMLKKRMARRWLVLAVVCRLAPLWMDNSSWGAQLSTACTCGFVAVLAHATAFWVLDEYRAFMGWNAKSVEPADKKKVADPFAPTSTDVLLSNILLILLITRILNVGWIALVRGTTSEEENVLSCILMAVQWIWPWSMDSTRAAVAARVAGWIHDGLILTLLLVLVATGAKMTGESARSKLHSRQKH
ncbi:hypothetical protein EMPS_03436 [Entomortierella parvispora]|uniref:Ima1 N-terminal domain-containing protein n=1 Tax=Entomortierella parvispora TaxID=205924 RepID=A0A9P3H6S3_9FUNG|nr:hypothetical protein EMPS_03436 [Entomortierella parvispora]